MKRYTGHLVALSLLCFFVLWGLYTRQFDMQKEAARIVRTCADAPLHDECYEKEIPKIMDRGRSMAEGFLLTQSVQQLDPTFLYCHMVAHALAEKEVAKDPSNWKKVALEVPLDSCSSGAIHGVFREALQELGPASTTPEVLFNDMVDVCTSGEVSTAYKRNSCIHAAGHMFMFATKGNLKSSYNYCDQLSGKLHNSIFVWFCYSGAGMQFFYLLEPSDYALVDGKRPEKFEEGVELCNAFEGLKRASCITQAVLAYHAFPKTSAQAQAATRECERIPEKYGRDQCTWVELTGSVTRITGDTSAIYSYCTEMDVDLTPTCLAASASRLVELDVTRFDEAVGICAFADTHGGSKNCYERLAQIPKNQLREGDSKREELCLKLPVAYADLCRAYVQKK